MTNLRTPRSTLLVMVATVMAALVVEAVGVQTSAYAHDHQPPKTVLMKGAKTLQTGRLGSYCWTNSSGSECGDVAALFYPAADKVRAGSRLHVRILKAQKPEEFSVTAYHRVDEWGWPVGGTRQLEASLRRVVEDGRTVAWDAFFRVDRPNTLYYLSTFGIWKDADGGGNQDASWTFRVQTRASST